MIGILGGGAWGTALANAAVSAGNSVTLWARDAAQIDEINTHHSNERYLPGLSVAQDVHGTTELHDLAGAAIILAVVPAQAMRQVLNAAAPVIAAQTPIVLCAKGLERGSEKFMSDVLRETVPQAIPAMLSGPSFASDVTKGLPTAVTLAARDEALAQHLAQKLGSRTFRLYHSTDLRGVEIGGAAKNVLAIASGIVTGRQLGASAAAALTARAFAELFRFGKSLGARSETLTGLSGLGDLILSCSGPQSRNFALGLALGQGEPLAAILARGKLAEGAFTAEVLIGMAGHMGIEMPISAAVHALLNERLTIEQAITALMARPQKAE